MPEEYLTVKNARLKMQVSENKIAGMLASGELPWIPNPRHKTSKLIPVSAIEAWLRRASVSPPIERGKKKQEQEEVSAQVAAA